MTEVKIPFRWRFRGPMLSGKKTMTSRTSKMGQAGDTFTAFGHRFEITRVQLLTLDEISEKYWREEGVESPSQFVIVWNSIHPVKRFVKDQLVFSHIFKRLEK